MFVSVLEFLIFGFLINLGDFTFWVLGYFCFLLFLGVLCFSWFSFVF